MREPSPWLRVGPTSSLLEFELLKVNAEGKRSHGHRRTEVLRGTRASSSALVALPWVSMAYLHVHPRKKRSYGSETGCWI